MRRRTILAGLGALVATLAVLAGVRLYPSSNPDIGFASPDGELTCSVKPSCDGDEVEILRMSSPVNAHAGTPSGSAYTYKLCCDGGVGNECAGHFDTVLTLSAEDNAHVAVDGSYSTQVCLSAPDTVAQCTYGDTCGPAYTCLATVSGVSNAHIADCDGVDDYPTKVCCTACDWAEPSGDPDFDWLTNDAEDKNGDGDVQYDPDRLLTETDPCDLDTDGDGCADIEEQGSDKMLGGLRHPVDEWDFFDVPAPPVTGPDPTNGGTVPKDKNITTVDTLAVLDLNGTSAPDSCNVGGFCYHEAYDRSPNLSEPWAPEGPDGNITTVDALANLDSNGDTCAGEP